MLARCDRFLPSAARLVLLAGAVPVAIPSAGMGQTPVLVRDINTRSSASLGSSSPTGLVKVGGRVYFRATGTTGGAELYATDGTAAGTVRVKDIHPTGDSSPGNLTRLDATRFVFTANDGVNGVELWISDGTEAGTTLLAEIRPGASGGSVADVTWVQDGLVMFSADDGVSGREVWRTDGTSGGTFRVSEIGAGSASAWSSGVPAFTLFAGRVFFRAGPITNTEVYTYDPATPGVFAAQFGELNPSTSTGSNPQFFTVFSPTQMIFQATVAGPSIELFTTDGTFAGTTLLKDIHTSGSSSPSGFVHFNSRLYFLATNGIGATGGVELYSTDGTTAGTVQVADINPGLNGSLSATTASFRVCNGVLYFNANDGTSGPELWFTTTGGVTQSIGDLIAGSSGISPQLISCVNFTGLGERLIFSGNDPVNGRELWISDGTAAGTQLLKDIDPTSAAGVPGSGGPQAFVELGGRVLFVATSDTGGTELWTSDGTTSGTVQLVDLRPVSNGSAPAHLTAVGSSLFFAADDGVNGTELWTSDGTTAGTVLVKDIGPAAAATPSSFPQQLAGSGGVLYFQANDQSSGTELWKSDGSAAGTVRVVDINPGAASGAPVNLFDTGAGVLFAANDGSAGVEPWFTDGTTSMLVSNIQAGAANSSPSGFTRIGTDVYFSATGSAGNELHRFRPGATPMDPPTIALVADINQQTATAGSSPGSLVVLNDVLIFAATNSNGVFPSVNTGRELWAFDPASGLATQLADIAPGTASSNPAQLTVAGGRVFFVATEPATGAELYVTDGTTGGTVLVRDIFAGSGGSGITGLTALGSRVVFRANDGNGAGVELWVSDGTAAGTVLVTDINPSGDSTPSGFAVAEGRVYFQANNGVDGTELWASDASAAGTVMVADLNPATAPAGSSNPANLRLVGQTLFFTADNGQTGTELFALDVSPACAPDFNNSGTVTVQDIFDFLAAYFSNLPSADFNNSGTVTVQDIFDFLAAYFTGCP